MHHFPKVLDRVARLGDFVFAEIDGEAVALSVDHGACFALNGVGLRILELLRPGATIDEICRQLQAEFDVDAETCARDVIDLFARFEAEGFVVIERAGSAV